MILPSLYDDYDKASEMLWTQNGLWNRTHILKPPDKLSQYDGENEISRQLGM
jgi:hypothetical protein